MAKNKGDSIYRESWYDETGKRLVLTCDAYSCLVELTLPHMKQLEETLPDSTLPDCTLPDS